MPIVSPGHNQEDLLMCLILLKYDEAWKRNKCSHYSISNKNSYSILQVAKMFNSPIVFLKSRPGERYASALTKLSYNNKVISKFEKIKLKNYINTIIKSIKYLVTNKKVFKIN